MSLDWPPPPGLVWLAGGLVLMLLEALTPGLFLFWIGLAALGAGLATWAFDLPFAVEVLAFALCATASIGLGLRLRHRRPAHGLNTPASGLVGRTARTLTFHGREGRVRVGDSDWPARLAPGAAPPDATTPLDVVGVDGTVLLVRPRPPHAAGP